MNRRFSLTFLSIAAAVAFLVGWAPVPSHAQVPEPMLFQHDPGYTFDLSFADIVLPDRAVVVSAREAPPVIEPEHAKMTMAPAVLASIDITARSQHFRRLRWEAG